MEEESGLWWSIVCLLRFLVFSFWLGQINPYSFELVSRVLGYNVVPFAWCYTWQLGVSIFGAFLLSLEDGELLLHVVWLF